jgi:hypothetical protein
MRTVTTHDVVTVQGGFPRCQTKWVNTFPPPLLLITQIPGATSPMAKWRPNQTETLRGRMTERRQRYVATTVQDHDGSTIPARHDDTHDTRRRTTTNNVSTPIPHLSQPTSLTDTKTTQHGNDTTRKRHNARTAPQQRENDPRRENDTRRENDMTVMLHRRRDNKDLSLPYVCT